MIGKFVKKLFLVDRLRFAASEYQRWKGCLNRKELFQLISDILLKRSTRRDVTIGKHSVRLRSNTPDFYVAYSCLLEGEYDDIELVDPRYIIDAGANIGTSAVYFASKYPDAMVIAIEPEDDNFNLLTRNTASFNNIECIQAALWGTEQRREIKNRFTRE